MLDIIHSLGCGRLQLSQNDILKMFTSEIAIIIYVFVILCGCFIGMDNKTL